MNSKMYNIPTWARAVQQRPSPKKVATATQNVFVNIMIVNKIDYKMAEVKKIFLRPYRSERRGTKVSVTIHPAKVIEPNRPI